MVQMDYECHIHFHNYDTYTKSSVCFSMYWVGHPIGDGLYVTFSIVLILPDSTDRKRNQHPNQWQSW